MRAWRRPEGGGNGHAAARQCRVAAAAAAAAAATDCDAADCGAYCRMLCFMSADLPSCSLRPSLAGHAAHLQIGRRV